MTEVLAGFGNKYPQYTLQLPLVYYVMLHIIYQLRTLPQHINYLHFCQTVRVH